MRPRSHTISLRSAPHELMMVSCLGDQPIWKTSSVWLVKVCSRWFRFLTSKSATVLSALPVASTYSLNGLNARQFTSAWCASTLFRHAPSGALRVSQSFKDLSSPTEPNMCSCLQCQATSSTTPRWPV